MGEPLIELKGVSKSFGSNVILDKVDLIPGNGYWPFWYCKSTILRIIAGLLAHDAGEVYVQGQRRQGLMRMP